jgi:spore maturation protein CgeB
MKLDIVIFGLAISSSWGNGHAVTYRSLVKALHDRGHRVTFFERDTTWYREHRDVECFDYCRLELYRHLEDIAKRFAARVSNADLAILGSYVPDGIAVADWITTHARGVTAFYDIDTPVTLAGLDAGNIDYISGRLIPRFDLYLSFTGGPTLNLIEDLYGSPRARALYCAADPEIHAHNDLPKRWSLGYLGTYSSDRQPELERLLFDPARRLARERFVVAGPQYPDGIAWPENVERIEHLPPLDHPKFYGQQRYTLNITRADMRAAGFSPSVRLFEAAACGTPIISDRWTGLETFFEPGREIVIVDTPQQVTQAITEMPEQQRCNIAAAARAKLLKAHTPQHRARKLEDYYGEVIAEERARIGAEIVA